MGKIFGISDLPTSTILSPFEPMVVPKQDYVVVEKPPVAVQKSDIVVLKNSPDKKMKLFKNIKNLFRKLIK